MHSIHVLRALAIASTSSFVLACSSSPGGHRSETTSEPIINGTVDNGDPAIVAVFAVKDAQTGSGALCTGEIISPHVVLTASHCVSAIALGFVPQKVVVLTGTNALKNATVLETRASVPHYAYDPQGGDNDIAVVLLAQATNIPPIAINREPIEALNGSQARIVGYGRTKDNDNNSVGVKNQASVHVSQIDAHHFLAADLPTTQCHGDSGGPTLVTIAGQERIIGVGWRTVRNDGLCDQGVRDTRVDPYLSFVDQYVSLLDGGGSGGGNPPAPPPPGGGGGNPPPPGGGGGGGGGNACPGSAVSVIANAGGACAPTANAYPDGHCAGGNDCGVVCCACAGGSDYATQVCADGKCVGGQAACACALQADTSGLLCQ